MLVITHNDDRRFGVRDHPFADGPQQPGQPTQSAGADDDHAGALADLQQDGCRAAVSSPDGDRHVGELGPQRQGVLVEPDGFPHLDLIDRLDRAPGIRVHRLPDRECPHDGHRFTECAGQHHGLPGRSLCMDRSVVAHHDSAHLASLGSHRAYRQPSVQAVRLLPADDPGLPGALAAALDGGPPLAPLPPEPATTLRMLQPEQPVTEPDAAVIVATSGSTGTPNGVVLSRRAIVAGAEATQARIGGPGHWTLALPAHYVAGIMVVARAVLAGTRLHRATPDLSDLPHLAGRNYLSLVPTQLVRGLADPRIKERLAGYDAILLGGAAADPALLDQAARAGLRVITTYGLSETAGGCVYDGVPLDDVDVTLLDGRVVITGDVVFSGYRLRPDLTAELLDGRTLRTPDRGEWAGGRLRILGRIDDVVTSGGVNVDLAAVERALRQLDPHAAAIGVPDPDWGARVVAAVTTSVSLADLRAALTTLEPAARPRGLLRHPHLPHTSSGKIDRQTLIGWWRTGPAQKEFL